MTLYMTIAPIRVLLEVKSNSYIINIRNLVPETIAYPRKDPKRVYWPASKLRYFVTLPCLTYLLYD